MGSSDRAASVGAPRPVPDAHVVGTAAAPRAPRWLYAALSASALLLALAGSYYAVQRAQAGRYVAVSPGDGRAPYVLDSRTGEWCQFRTDPSPPYNSGVVCIDRAARLTRHLRPDPLERAP